MRRNPASRCAHCMVHLENCFCHDIKQLNLKTKVSFVIFKKEIFLPSNTAHLAVKSLQNAQIHERGHKGLSLDKSFIDEGSYEPLFLYPAEDATELEDHFIKNLSKPINLIIPDGTWRQAKKIHRREPLLNNIKQVKITPQNKSIYPLRRQKFKEGLCTFEAMSEALRVIEGLECYESLMKNFRIFLDAHLKNRAIYEKP